MTTKKTVSSTNANKIDKPSTQAQTPSNDNPFGADLWLYIASDCLRRYAAEYPMMVTVRKGTSLTISLPNISLHDPRLHSKFSSLITIENNDNASPILKE